MDTHFERAEINLDDRDRPLSQSTSQAVPVPDPLLPAAPVPAPQGRRHRLLMNTASGAVVAVAAAGVFWISPYNPYTLADVSQIVGSAGRQARTLVNTMPSPDPPVAPAAQLARAREPVRTPTNPVRPLQQSGSGDDMADFLSYQAGTSRQTAAVQATRPDKTSEVATVPAKPVTDTAVQKPEPRAAVPSANPPPPEVTAAEGFSVPPQSPNTTASPSPPSAPVFTAPKEPVAVAAQHLAAPMAPPEQVQVLELVTKLGTVIGDLRLQVTQLRQSQSDLAQRVDGTLTDFTRRIALSEARGALNAAQPPDLRPAPSSSALMTAPVLPVAVRQSPPAPSPPPVEATSARYRVAAASPGLAMLSQLDASGGEQRQLAVSPGQDIPGYGKVVSIAQRGTTWIVKTDRGAIQ